MANPITIYQTQSILFTSTSSGGQPPYGYLWSFNGGNISSSTGATALVSYSNPGSYSATLTVTDSNNLTNFLTESNFITVNPAEVTASFTKSSSDIKMSTSINFTDTSTGLPTNPDSWVWDIAGQAYTTQNVTGVSYSDWVSLPGASYTDVPGHQLTVTAQLEASTAYVSDVDSQNFIVRKLGPVETIQINKDELNYSNNTSFSFTGYTTSYVGLPGDYLIYEITGPNSNSYFHSTQEAVSLTCTGLGSGEFINQNGVATITGQIVVDPTLYGYGDPTVEDGKYIIPGYTPTIYYADGGYLTYIYDTYTIPADTLAQIIFNRYPHVNSLQGAMSGYIYQQNSSGNKYNPIVPSPTYMTNHGASGLVYTLRFDVTISGTTSTMIIPFNANSGVGNEPGGSGEFYVMQDVGPDDGIATQINDAIISTLGSTGSVEAFASQTYSPPFGNSTNYYGLQIAAKTPSVTAIVIGDNSSTINAALTSGSVLRFGVSPSYIGDSCTGIVTTFSLTTYALSGTELDYGGSIF